jgi:hypothetical protein
MGLSPNQYLILHLIKEEKNIPNCFISLNAEVRTLIVEGYLTDNLVLTDKGNAVLGDAPEIKVNKPAPLKVTPEMIEDYLNIWPPIKLPSGKYARVAMKNIETQFKWFFKNYDIDWKTVLQATSMYVNEYELKGYKYMQTSYYFISKSLPDKSRNSELANYCELIKQGITDTTNPNHFSDKVV